MFAINYVKILSDILEIEYQTNELLSLLKKMTEKNNLDKYTQEIKKRKKYMKKIIVTFFIINMKNYLII